MISSILLIAFIKVSLHYNNPIALAAIYTAATSIFSAMFGVEFAVLIYFGDDNFRVDVAVFLASGQIRRIRRLVGDCNRISGFDVRAEFRSIDKFFDFFVLTKFRNYCHFNFSYQSSCRAQPPHLRHEVQRH